MSKSKTPVLRSRIAPEDTWNLKPLFRSDAAWEKNFRQLERRLPEVESFRGSLGRSC